MITLGLTGPIGHGKSTFAQAVSELEPSLIRFESSLIVGEIVDALHASTMEVPSRDNIDKINDWLKPLPAIILERVHAHCTFDQIKLDIDEVNRHPIEYEKLFLHIDNLHRQPELLKHQVTKENKESYRPILQWLGGYLVRRVDPGVWYKEIISRVEKASNEGYKLCVVGGLRFPNDARLLRGIGAKIIKVYRPGHLQYDRLDPTERERENIPVDCTIVSDGTVDDLKRCAKKVMDDLYAAKLQTIYYATQS